MLSQSTFILRHVRLASVHLMCSLYVMTVGICLDVQHAGGLPLNDDVNLRAGVDQTVLRRGRREVVVVNKPSVCKTDDEFYDAVVRRCARCSDVCGPRHEDSFCMNNCPAYYRQHLLPVDKRSGSTSPKTTSGSGLSAVGAGGDQLIRKPLFWTSVASLTVAVAASVVIVVLCVVQRQKPHRGETVCFGRSPPERTQLCQGNQTVKSGAEDEDEDKRSRRDGDDSSAQLSLSSDPPSYCDVTSGSGDVIGHVSAERSPADDGKSRGVMTSWWSDGRRSDERKLDGRHVDWSNGRQPRLPSIDSVKPPPPRHCRSTSTGDDARKDGDGKRNGKTSGVESATVETTLKSAMTVKGDVDEMDVVRLPATRLSYLDDVPQEDINRLPGARSRPGVVGPVHLIEA